MATIRETLTLEDKFSAAFTRYLQLGDKAVGAATRAQNAATNYQAVLNRMDRELISLNAEFTANVQRQEAMVAAGQKNTAAFRMLDTQTERLGASIRSLSAQYDLVEKEAEKATNAAKKFDNANKSTQQSASVLSGTLLRMAGVFVSIQTAKWLVNTSDQLTQINARLQMMTGSAEQAAQANDKIYQAAMRARGSYIDMANLVSQLGTMAPEAFSDPAGNLNTDELIAFAEQLQKQMALSGASTTAAQAAMLQLSQGLASGTLRGEELNSVLKQTPMIAQTIADYMGVDIGTMRQLASEGAITADVVKSAVLGAAEETNAAFAEMPMTWGQMFDSLKNIAITSLQPLFDFVGSIPQLMIDNYPIVISVMLGIAAAIAVVGTQAMIAAAKIALANLPLILIIALVAAVVYAAIQAGATISDVLEVVGQGFGFLYAFIGNIVVQLYNLWASFAEFFANVFNDPVTAIANLFFDLVDTILGLLETAAGAIDALFGSNLADAVGGWRKDLQSWVDKNVGENEIKIDRMENISYSEAMDQFGQYGRELGDKLQEFADGFTSSSGTSVGGVNIGQMSNQLSNISDSVKDIEKSVNMSEEDIKSLVDVAERRYVNQVNLTSQTPVITVNGANTGNTAADRRAIADAIRDVLIEQVASGSARTTARAF